MMTRRHFLLSLGSAAAGLVVAPSVRAAAGDLVLVLNAKNGANPDPTFAKRLFIGEALYWPGNVGVCPFVRPADALPGERFFRTIGMTPARFKRLWQEKQLSGQGVMPETIPAAAALVAKVAANVGAIGVALAEEIPANAPGVRLVTLG